MIKLLALLIVSTSGHGRVGKDIYNSHLVNTDPVQTPEMKLFIRKNRFKMENCLRYAGIRRIKLQNSHQISAYCQNKSASHSYSTRTSFGIENMQQTKNNRLHKKIPLLLLATHFCLSQPEILVVEYILQTILFSV